MSDFQFRVPGADAPQFLEMLESLEAMKGALLRVEAAAKKGQLPASSDIKTMAEVLVFFSTDTDKEAVRERVMNFSLNDYITAVSALMPKQQQPAEA